MANTEHTDTNDVQAAREKINEARLILNGIEAIAGSYMDGGLMSGCCADTESLFGLASMAIKALDEATEALHYVREENIHAS